MSNPLSAAAAGVLALAAAGLFLLGQPAPEQVGKAPAAVQLAAPVPFAATYSIGPGVISESTTETPGVGSRSTGGVWQWSVVQEASDERLRGTTYIHRNHDSYREDGILDINYSMLRIENDGGAWLGLPVLYAADSTGPSFPVTLIGEGGHEGLYAVGTLSRLSSGFWELEGHIFEGSLLPAPEPFVAE